MRCGRGILLHAGEYAEALRWLEQAHARALQAGDRGLAAQALYDMGIGYYYQDRFPEAAAYFGEAQPIFRELGDRRGEINALLMFGTISSRQGDHDAGRERLNEALALCHEIGWRHGETYVLGNLANSYFELGDYARRNDCMNTPWRLRVRSAIRRERPPASAPWRSSSHRLGDPTRALELYRQASAIQARNRGLAGRRLYADGNGSRVDRVWETWMRRREPSKRPWKSADVWTPILRWPWTIWSGWRWLRYGAATPTGPQRMPMTPSPGWKKRGVDGIEFPVQAWLVCYRAYAANAEEDRSAHGARKSGAVPAAMPCCRSRPRRSRMTSFAALSSMKCRFIASFLRSGGRLGG